MMTFQARFRFCFVFVNLLVAFFSGGALIAAAQQPSVGVINAAGYTELTAPDSIAALFGLNLATRTEIANTVPLPTSLAGTTVSVDGQAAMLFFVAPTQVNFLVPAGTRTGRVNVVVTSGDGKVSRGQMQVQNTAAGVFTQNASGVGVPAAQLIRVRNGVQSYELPYQQLADERFVTKPIDFGPPGDEVYLVLFATGVRRASSVKVVGGGLSLDVLFAGAQGGFAGLDQINVLLPRTLANRGQVSFTLTIPNAVASNAFDLEFRQADAVPIAIESFNPRPAVVGQSLSIVGRGFSSDKTRNQVRILGAAQYEALVTSASSTLLTVLIPFGAEGGTLSVSNLDGAGSYANSTQSLALKTSVSGAFKDTLGNKIKNMQVKVTDAQGKTFTETTNDEGVFVIAGLAAGTATIELSGGTSATQLPYPQIAFKKRINPDRDTTLDYPTTLQAVNGTSSNLNADGTLSARSLRLSVPPTSAAPDGLIRNGEVVLDVPDNAVIAFPDGRPVNQITLSLVGRSLTPVALPSRHFSQTIVMISPLGATIMPGAKLTFPNTDGFPANAQVELFRFNQQRDTEGFGDFISAGTA
ncbi:MAG TPA: IPT/TIG domain-containing protein, partial [Blastocatellia bacterium]|nr:IPT/TIG domain-containing protein [Blastocatellia bacterium]